jgi:hypothetical protein
MLMPEPYDRALGLCCGVWCGSNVPGTSFRSWPVIISVSPQAKGEQVDMLVVLCEMMDDGRWTIDGVHRIRMNPST